MLHSDVWGVIMCDFEE